MNRTNPALIWSFLAGAGPVGFAATLPTSMYDPDAQALFARFTTPPTDARKAALNTFIKACKSAGVWTKFDGLYLLAAADSQAARRNVVADQYNLTPVNAPAFTADRGYTGDGSSSYLQTGAPTNALAKLGQNSAHEMVWSRTDRNDATGTGVDMGLSSGAQFQLQGRGANNMQARVQSAANSAVVVADSLGLYGWSRTAATVGAFYKNGSNILAVASTSAALTANMILILNSGGTQFGLRQLSFACFGAGLTDADAAALYSAVQAYLQNVGAA